MQSKFVITDFMCPDEAYHKSTKFILCQSVSEVKALEKVLSYLKRY